MTTDDKAPETPELDSYESKLSDDAPLSPRQEMFCQQYVIDFNATKAAERAMYSINNAQQQGSRLLSKALVQERIKELMELKTLRNQATADFVLAKMVEIAKLDISGAYDENGRLKNIHDIPIHIRRAITAIETFQEVGYVNVEDGEHGEERVKEVTGTTIKLKFASKERMLELLGKHLKLLTDKVEHSNPDGQLKPLFTLLLPDNGRGPKDDA